MRLQLSQWWRRIASLIGAALTAIPARAAVLPEDRTDAMLHHYKGGGVEVSGPALLVRKSLADTFSFSAGYYVDTVSSASVDVVTTASPYKEKRTEYRGGVDFLEGNSIVGLSVVTSSEPDYTARSVGFNASHELFGAMTTVSLGYTQGEDEVRQTGSTFEDKIERQQYRLGISQVITKKIVASLNYEAIAEDGFLNSPYRSALLLGAYVPERYPRTRNSHAVAARAIMALQESGGRPVSSLTVGARTFSDSWAIEARDIEFIYQRYLRPKWIGEISYRYYTQDAASFYSDNFSSAFTYMARDKELSTFQSHALSLKSTWSVCSGGGSVFRCEASIALSRMHFDYDNFTDVRTGELFSFNATTVHAYFSVWY